MAGLCLSLPLYGISLEIGTAPDGHRRSDDRLGEGTPAVSCPSGYVCDPIGTVTDCSVEDVGGVVTFVTINPIDTSGVCPALKTYVSETDWHCEFTVTSVSGGGQYAGAGCELSQSDGDYSTPDPKAYCWYSDGRVRMKYDVGRAGQTTAISAALTLPVIVGSEYDDTTNSYVCGYKIGVDFFQVGTTQTALAFTSGVRGVFSSGYHATNAATIITDDWEDTTTRDPYVDEGEPEPPPPGMSDTPDRTDLRQTYIGGRNTVPVSNSSALTSALSAAQCGDDITMAAGTYAGSFSLSKTTCPANNPIQVIGASNFTSVATGSWTFSGHWYVIRGVFFNGADARVTFSAGTGNSLLANQLTDWEFFMAINAASGSGGEIAYNKIFTPGPWPAGCPPTCPGPPLRMGIRTGENTSGSNLYTNMWVHHNYFFDFPTKPIPNNYGTGQDDAIELCQSNVGAYIPGAFDSSPSTDLPWYIEYNVVEQHLQGSGVFDLKCPAIVRYNTFRNVPGGRIDFRGPSSGGGTIESNYFKGSGGMTIHGGNHRIIGNTLVSMPELGLGAGNITLVAGDKGSAEVNTVGANHSRTENVIVAGNSGSLRIGSVQTGASTLPALNNEIEEHTGSILLTEPPQLHDGTVNNSGMMTSINFVPAVELSAEQVGPSALASASADYRARRGL